MTAHNEAADVVTCIMVDDGIHARYAPRGNETRISTISRSLHTHTSNTVMPGSLPALGPAPWDTLPCPTAELTSRCAHPRLLG